MMKAAVLGAIAALALFAACGGSSSGGGSGGNGGGTSCSDVCPNVLAAHCSSGPTSQNDCVSGCEQVRAKCGPQWDAVLKCAGPNPTFACDPSGQVAVQGCSAENAALSTCISS